MEEPRSSIGRESNVGAVFRRAAMVLMRRHAGDGGGGGEQDGAEAGAGDTDGADGGVCDMKLLSSLTVPGPFVSFRE